MEALQLLQANNNAIDLALLDVMMPGMTGIELVVWPAARSIIQAGTEFFDGFFRTRAAASTRRGHRFPCS